MADKITLTEVKAKARAAHTLGLLTAQAPHWEDVKCVNFHVCHDGVTRRCAVAWAFSAEFAENNIGGALATVSRVSDFETPAAFDAASFIQCAHDDWAGARRHEMREAEGLTADDKVRDKTAAEYEAIFLKSLED